MASSSTRSGGRLLTTVVLALALLVGGFAAYWAYLVEAEGQFHGGVLEEDRAAAELALVWEPAWAFFWWTLSASAAFGSVAIVARLLWKARA